MTIILAVSFQSNRFFYFKGGFSMPKKIYKRKRWVGFFVLFLLVIVLISAFYKPNEDEPAKYSEIVSMIYKGEISEFKLDVRTGKIEYVLRDTQEKLTAVIPDPELFHEDVADFIIQHNLEADKENQIAQDYVSSFDFSVLFSILPTMALIVVAVILFKKISSMGAMGGNKGTVFGPQGRHQLNTKSKNQITFKDVAGCDEEKAELVEIVDFLKNPKKYTAIGARIPHGVLLVGPPGTGKTLLAKSVAGEAGVPFYTISGSDFVEMYAGVGAKRVRELFESAKSSAPAIIFIDEIDAVGRRRGADVSSGADSEREQTLNQLLVELDGFNNSSGIIVLAATNRPDVLDSALLRPGRFDRQILVNYPDIKGREAILNVHARGKTLSPDVNFKTIASQTHGFTGADIANLLNEAALKAVKEGRKMITNKDIADSMVKVIIGVEKKTMTVNENEKMLTSYHEVGHAIVSYALSGGEDKVSEISIISRGSAAGYTLYNNPTNYDKIHITEKEMRENICSLLGGRAAEEIYTNGNVSSGASSDISRATSIARKMVVSYGMSKKLGIIDYAGGKESFDRRCSVQPRGEYSETTAALIDEEIRNIVSTEYERAKDVLKANREKLDAISKELSSIEKMSGERFMELMK